MATEVFADKSIMNNFGPMKMEIIPLTAVANGETITSRMQNPQHAFMVADGDAGGAAAGSVAIGGTLGRTLTLHDPPITTNIVIVFGW